MTKLNQIIAVEKGIKNKVNQSVSQLYKSIQKPALFDGFVKSWEKREESGEDRPPERRRVQLNVDDVLSTMSDTLTELFDITAQKDFANCEARADVVIGGTPLLTGVPATYLLFLEKQLKDIKSVIQTLPTLSADDDWNRDVALGLFKTDPVSTRSTAKVVEPILMAPATKEHPAQTQLITKDVTIGHWITVKQSGAIVESDKKKLMKKVETLTKAVKFAWEEANGVSAPPKMIGDVVFDYLFNQ